MRVVPDEVWAGLTVWMEARGETHDGRVAVAEVIRNRTARKYDSDGTVPGTVLHPVQFSCWNTHDPNRIAAAHLDADDAMLQDCIAAWHEALAGSDLARGAVLYYNPAAVVETPGWVAQSTEVARIGRHVFFVPQGG